MEKFYPNILLVSGMSRNTGKTRFILEVIERFSRETQIVALKVTSIRPDEAEFHGEHETGATEEYSIYEEKDTSSHKDTSKMLRAGASRAFLVSSREEWLNDAVEELFKKVSSSSLFVCESGSLRSVLKPGVMVMVTSGNEENIKSRAVKMAKLADLTVRSSNNLFSPDTGVIGLEKGRWVITEPER